MGRGLALVFAPEFPQPPVNADPQGHSEQNRFWGGRDREVTRVTCGRPGSRPLEINCSVLLWPAPERRLQVTVLQVMF